MAEPLSSMANATLNAARTPRPTSNTSHYSSVGSGTSRPATPSTKARRGLSPQKENLAATAPGSPNNYYDAQSKLLATDSFRDFVGRDGGEAIDHDMTNGFEGDITATIGDENMTTTMHGMAFEDALTTQTKRERVSWEKMGTVSSSPRKLQLKPAGQDERSAGELKMEERRSTYDYEIPGKEKGRNGESILGADDSILTYQMSEEGTVSKETESPSKRAGYDEMNESCFSTFSAVPTLDMTRFARLGAAREAYNSQQNSPSKQLYAESNYDRYQSDSRMTTPGTANRYRSRGSSPSPTPRRRRERNERNDTNPSILEDFTEQMNMYTTSAVNAQRYSPNKPYSKRSPVKSQTQPDLGALLGRGRTPSPSKRGAYSSRAAAGLNAADSQQFADLLDFDIPPAPTPRSVPSITARELESLKSAYLSEISSLRASLSGKTAEVSSLKDAVGDAERRVGETLEHLRDERGRRETVAQDRDNWEKRGKEMETVLRSVRSEIMNEEREKEALQGKLEESERARDELEAKLAEAGSRTLLDVGDGAGGSSKSESEQAAIISREVDIAVEKVARDLHALYKTKHETKVAALKKSYESRWEKRVREVERRLEESVREAEELRVSRDATFSGVVPADATAGPNGASIDPEAEQKKEQERIDLKQQMEEQKAKLSGLSNQISTVQEDNIQLRLSLERERVEKGDLVAAVEEMLMMQAAAGTSSAPTPAMAASGIENLRGSISRASGLRGPGFTAAMPSSLARPSVYAAADGGTVRGSGGGGGGGESRIARSNSTDSIGRVPRPHSRSGSGIAAPKSGMMSSIERMGRGRD